jgi:hypothetical protein
MKTQFVNEKRFYVIRTLAVITLVTIMFCYVVTSFFDWTSSRN